MKLPFTVEHVIIIRWIVRRRNISERMSNYASTDYEKRYFSRSRVLLFESNFIDCLQLVVSVTSLWLTFSLATQLLRIKTKKIRMNRVPHILSSSPLTTGMLPKFFAH